MLTYPSVEAVTTATFPSKRLEPVAAALAILKWLIDLPTDSNLVRENILCTCKL